MRQSSPLPAARPPADGSRPEIVFVHGQPTEFRHEHYLVRLTRRPATGGAGQELVEIVAQALVSVGAVVGTGVSAADLRGWDRDVQEGFMRVAPWPTSAHPDVLFPPYRISVASDDPEEVTEMTWRALEGAVVIADRCLGVLGQILPLRAEQIRAVD